MSKRASALPHVLRPRGPGELVSRWLAESLRASILDGQLRPGSRLPASRDLARQYGVARGTVVVAFEELAAQGYLRSAVGSGTYVHDTLPEGLLPAVRLSSAQPAGRGRRSGAPAARPTALSPFARRVRPFGALSPGPARAFRTDVPALDLFPTTLWAQVAGRRLRNVTASDLSGSAPLGYAPLRVAVADYLRTARGVRCEVEQVAIVSGAQEALDLVARLVIAPGDAVAVEDPGYVGATRVFEAWGARVRPIAVDGEGMHLPPRGGRARLAYVTPAHQFPLGVAMSLPRRLALLEWARSERAWIFEDDYDSEFRFSGRPLPALQGLDPHGVVIFCGSFSKVLFPALRLGYLVLPPDLVELVGATLSIVTRHAPVLSQAVLADFLAEGHFARHVRRMRDIYAERWTVLWDSAQSELAGLLEISPIEAGLQTAAFLPPGVDDEEAARAAAAHGVEATPLSRYARRRMARGGLQLGFAPVDARQIRRGVRDLASALT